MSRSDIPTLLIRARYALEPGGEDGRPDVQAILELLLGQIKRTMLFMEKKERVELIEAIEQYALEREIAEGPHLKLVEVGH